MPAFAWMPEWAFMQETKSFLALGVRLHDDIGYSLLS
jgi:hypothetical protein